MAYINVDEVYILDNTGAQVDAVTDIPFKQDAGLTDAQKAQARANLGVAGLDLGITGASIGQMPVVASVDGNGAPTSWNPATPSSGGGRNLLDNWYFPSGSVVNQRGFSSGSTEGYTVDRWKVTRSSIITATIGSTGMTISKSVSGYAFFEQKIGNALDLEADYTLSVMTADGTVYSATRKFVNGTSSETTVTIGGMNVGFGLYGKDGSPRASLYFGTSATGSIVIKAIKLELGSTSTLAQDAPPDYGEELAKCMRYFQRIKGTSTNYAPIGLGFTTSASSGVIAAVLVPLPVPLRATTVTVSKSGNLSLLSGTTSYTPTAITYYDHTEQQLRLNVTASGMTAGQFCYLQFSQSAAYIDLSADL